MNFTPLLFSFLSSFFFIFFFYTYLIRVLVYVLFTNFTCLQSTAINCHPSRLGRCQGRQFRPRTRQFRPSSSSPHLERTGRLTPLFLTHVTIPSHLRFHHLPTLLQAHPLVKTRPLYGFPAFSLLVRKELVLAKIMGLVWAPGRKETVLLILILPQSQVLCSELDLSESENISSLQSEMEGWL